MQNQAERTFSTAIWPGTKRFVTAKTAWRPVVVLMIAGKIARLVMLKSIRPAVNLMRNFRMRCHIPETEGCSRYAFAAGLLLEVVRPC